MRARHIAGVLNLTIDMLSRSLNPLPSEWTLHQDCPFVEDLRFSGSRSFPVTSQSSPPTVHVSLSGGQGRSDSRWSTSVLGGCVCLRHPSLTYSSQSFETPREVPLLYNSGGTQVAQKTLVSPALRTALTPSSRASSQEGPTVPASVSGRRGFPFTLGWYQARLGSQGFL